MSGLAPYGPQQEFRSLNYAVGGYFPGFYWGSVFQCSAGPNTPTSWFNNIYDSNGYAANWWVGASFVAINAATGTSYGSGTITASTANTGGTGTTFTLSPAISSACNPGQNDVLLVRLNGKTNLLTPNQFNSGICAAATWNTNDTDPDSTNTQQSLQMTNGCQASFIMDQVLRNATNPNPALASQFVPWININGSYTATFKAKCVVSGCTVATIIGREGGTTFVPYTQVNPTYNPTPGQGWNTYNIAFTGSETGAQGSSLFYEILCTGGCLIQDADVIESSTLPGNTTVFRDAVVYELQKIHPGSIRYMDDTQWCADVADQIAPMGNRRWCGNSPYVDWISGPPIGYADVLSLANLLGADAYISVGVLNQPSDWTMLINWLNSSGWISTFAASGHKIYLEDGNEAWNSAAPGSPYQGNGLAYGYTLGQNMAAAKAATGYDGSVVRLVANNWNAPTQGYGPYGWLALTMSAAGCTLTSRASCPDYAEIAPYTLNWLGTMDTSGNNVSPIGSPIQDELSVEPSNFDSVTSPPNSTASVYLNQQYALSTYNVATSVYEVNESTVLGMTTTQLEMNQIDASVMNGLSIGEHLLLMQRDAKVTGPMNVFTLANGYNNYNDSTNGVVMPLWGTTVMMATGPGQAPGSANVDRPINIALEIINNAIGSNNNLMSIAQSGTPTFSYAGGQPQFGTNSISANPAVPYVNCFAYADSAQANWTTICFNNNLTSSESVVLTGAGAPNGAVSETVFPNPSNIVTDNNEATYLGPSSVAPVVNAPAATSTSGTTYVIPPASMIALTYSVTGSPILAAPIIAPGGGTYSASQAVTINFPAGSTGCVGINTTPTAPTPGTCGSGGITYTGPITVSSSETINAIATEAGSTNSTVASAAFTINTALTATPTFNPAGGTYTGTQTVTITSSTAGATIYYTTDGSTPTSSSPVYTGPIAVSSSETVQAIAVASGYPTSAIGSAAYTINANPAATPVFSPAAGTYASSQMVSITTATPGATIYYTTNGAIPTSSSTTYSGPITVSGSETVMAIAVVSGYPTSAVGSAAYTINTTPAATPVFSPAAGTYTSAQTVSITTSTPGATIYYTTNGSAPTTSSALYSGPISVSNTETVQAIAVATGYPASAVGSAVYTINTTPAATPVFSPAAGTYTSAQTVSITTSTPGATIYYTTNGAMPTSSSTAYSGPISVSGSETVMAIAVVGGYPTSAVGSAAYTINTTAAATPVFSPAAGTYTSAQTVSITTSTPGATIYYTTNGSVPTTSSGVYAGPISVSSSETVMAIAVSSGYPTSAVGSAAYTVNTTPVAAPSFRPGSGTYTSPQTVIISSSTPGATIYYTTDGTTPTTNSTTYAGPLRAINSMTITAVAAAPGYPSSTPTSAAYTIIPPAVTPSFSPAAGVYTSAQTVSITTSTPGATIYYTTNGSTPTTSSPVYSGPISVPNSETVQAIAVATSYTTSAVGSAAYTINTTPAATPSFSPAAGTYTSDQTVTIATSTPGATIRYTTNGTTPTVNSAIYTGPISVSSSETVMAIAVASGYPTSAVGSAAYTINTTAAATPSFSPAPGTYTAAQAISITSSTPGATIYYNTNGSVPTTSSAVYAGPIQVSSSETLMAIAVASGYPTSAVGSAAYTINTTAAATPSFSPASGTYTAAQAIGITSSTPGATIYYTTNGSVPTTSSAVYAGPIPVSSSETVMAIAVASGYPTSAVGSAAYTINTSPAATPVFSPAGGIYTSAQTVSITTPTPGAIIYYTTNGSVPTTSSAVYAGPFSVSSSENVMAIAVASGYPTSAVGSAAYTINTSPAATPVFSPAGGIYTSAQTVSITTPTPGAIIYYTTDGTVPTTSSAVYAGPIPVSSSETVMAIAVASGYPTSAVGSAAYTINTTAAATPSFNPAAGTYTSTQIVTIATSTPGATLYYTTNGLMPTAASPVYSGPISVSSSETVMAIAVASGYPTSAVGSAAYTLSSPTPPTSSVAVNPGKLSVPVGQTGAVAVVVTTQSSAADQLTFACAGLPDGASCTFSPANVTPTAGVASTVLTVSTTAPGSASRGNYAPWFSGSALAMAFCLFGRKKRRTLQLLMLAVAAVGLGICSGCGGNMHSQYQSVTELKESTVTVTATSASMQLTTTFTLALTDAL